MSGSDIEEVGAIPGDMSAMWVEVANGAQLVPFLSP